MVCSSRFGLIDRGSCIDAGDDLLFPDDTYLGRPPATCTALRLEQRVQAGLGAVDSFVRVAMGRPVLSFQMFRGGGLPGHARGGRAGNSSGSERSGDGFQDVRVLEGCGSRAGLQRPLPQLKKPTKLNWGPIILFHANVFKACACWFEASGRLRKVSGSEQLPGCRTGCVPQGQGSIQPLLFCCLSGYHPRSLKSMNSRKCPPFKVQQTVPPNIPY